MELGWSARWRRGLLMDDLGRSPAPAQLLIASAAASWWSIAVRRASISPQEWWLAAGALVVLIARLNAPAAETA